MSSANRTDRPRAPESEHAAAAALPPGGSGPPFGPAFFATVLHERVRAACNGHPEGVPAVELQLADGVTLDVCHVPSVEAPWLVAQVYRDRETCEDMDLVFVPYGLILRVTIAVWHRRERPIGFDLTGHAPALPAGIAS